jgi:hypothetical protein
MEKQEQKNKRIFKKKGRKKRTKRVWNEDED